jgi:GNAT superfamily N-acetyltransferase
MPPTIRPATRAELDIILDWAAAEGWNPGLDDAYAFWAADPGGFWLAEVEGLLAAALSIVRCSPDYGFLGFYMAHPDFRGKGIGWALWQAAMAAAGNTTIGLDGVVAQQQNYQRSGFAYVHRNIRHGGVVDIGNVSDVQVMPVAPAQIEALCAYDAAHSPAPRPAFMAAWLTDTATRHSFVLTQAGEIAGLATVRACRDGFKIGPLFAETEDGADRLFRTLAGHIGRGMVYLDSPEPNLAAQKLCARYNLTPMFETARMYRGRIPSLPLTSIFGIATFELG